MGKTYRRTDVKNAGYFDCTFRKARSNEDPNKVADNIFHSDKPKRWRGIDSEVKTSQAKISRADKRNIKHKVLCSNDFDTVNSDSLYKKKANGYYRYC